MKIEPELVDHPKYLLLRQKIGADALEILHRIWGHCEANKRGEIWRGASPDYLETVCRWKKTPGTLFAALTALGWVHLESDGIRIHDWEKTNWRAVTNWELGSRPKGKAQALDKPRLNQGISPLSEGMSEGVSEAVSLPEIQVPGKEECLAWAEVNGIETWWVADKWTWTNSTHGWERNRRLIDWRTLWKSWFEADVRSGKFKKNGGGKTATASGSVKRERGEILQQLEWARAEKNGALVTELETELKAA